LRRPQRIAARFPRARDQPGGALGRDAHEAAFEIEAVGGGEPAFDRFAENRGAARRYRAGGVENRFRVGVVRPFEARAFQQIDHSLCANIGNLGRDHRRNAPPHQRQRLRGAHPAAAFPHHYVHLRASHAAYGGDGAAERVEVAGLAKRQHQRRRLAAPCRLEPFLRRGDFLPVLPAVKARRQRVAYAYHRVDGRKLVGSARTAADAGDAFAVEVQGEELARARALGCEPVAHIEAAAAVAGARDGESGEILGRPAQRQVFPRRHGAGCKQREQRMVVSGGPVNVGLGGVGAGARVGEGEQGVGFVEHDEGAARQDVELELAQESLRAFAEHLLVRLGRELEQGEPAAAGVRA
jgi:hypothetical protein